MSLPSQEPATLAFSLMRILRTWAASGLCTVLVFFAFHNTQSAPPSYLAGVGTAFGSVRSFMDSTSTVVRFSPKQNMRYRPDFSACYFREIHIENPVPIFDRPHYRQTWNFGVPGLRIAGINHGRGHIEIHLRNWCIIAVTFFTILSVCRIQHPWARFARKANQTIEHLTSRRW